MVAVVLAEGFEEIEALAPVDVLRRAGAEVCVVGVGALAITGGHGITVQCDARIDDGDPQAVFEAVVLPGGMPGAENLAGSEAVGAVVRGVARRQGVVAAICAAPAVVLEPLGVLSGRRCTCYPTFSDRIVSATVVDAEVVVDNNLITASAAGVALRFGLAIVERVCSRAAAERVGQSMHAVLTHGH